MEGVEIEDPLQFLHSEDFCDSILSRFSNSDQEHHQHICAVLGAMSQELKDQNLPRTAVAYFGATCSSLNRLSSEPEPPGHAVDALLALLAIFVPRISVPILKKKTEYVSDLVVRVLRSKSITPAGAASGLKCLSDLLITGEKFTWSDVSSLYGFLLAYATDDRPKVRRQSHMCLHDVLVSFQGTPLLGPASEAMANTFERFLLLAGGSNASASEKPKGAQEVLYVLDALKDCLPLLSLKFSTTIMKYFKSLLEIRQPLVTRRIMNSLNALCLHQTLEISSELLLDLLCLLGLSISANNMSVDDTTFIARLLGVGMKKIYHLDRQVCILKLPLVFNALRGLICPFWLFPHIKYQFHVEPRELDIICQFFPRSNFIPSMLLVSSLLCFLNGFPPDVLAFEHKEALVAAMESFKSLIDSCIDENLIKQGIDQIMASRNEETRKSGPTIIEKICATVENLLDYQYAAVWDMSFQVALAMFSKLGMYSSYLLRETLKNLADMEKLPDEDFPFRKQLHECIGSALGAVGPETFLGILPLKLEAADLSEANVWLFPILKQYIIGARLSFFTESILGMIGTVKRRSQMLEQEGKIYSSRSVNGLVYSLWSLLPSFCNYPLDAAESLKELEKVLCHALREELDIRGIICSSLQILIQQNKRIVERKDDLSAPELNIFKQQAMARYTPAVAANNLNALKSSAREFLSVLLGIFMKLPKDAGGCLQTTIGEFASIADKEVVTKFFKITMRKLLKVTQEAGKAENPQNSNPMQMDSASKESSLSVARAQLLDLAVALLPGLDAEETDLLFAAIEPALKDAEGLIQKKAYKVLSVILRNSDGFLSRKLEELLNLMIDALPSCHFSAKRHRLDCLYFLIVHVSKDGSERRWQNIISSFLTEIILALKEANRKTRNRAYDILVQIGHVCGDEEKGGRKENLYQFFNMVAGGLAGETPHMVSAAVKGLARLAYEFSDLVSAAYNVLPSTFLLLQRKNKEIVKANLGLLKVLVAKSQAEGLQMHLSSMVDGLLKWQDSTKNHFKAKVKLLLEMLIKKCGLDAVKAVMPEEHMKLLTNIRKIKERKEKRIASNSEDNKSNQSKATTSRLSRWNHTKIFSDFGDEETDSDAEYMDVETTSGRRSKGSALLTSKASSLRSTRTRKAAKSLPEDLFDQHEDEPLDLLDRQKTRSALRSSEHHFKRKAESDDKPEVDAEGRLIIREEGQKPKEETSPDHSDSDDERSQAGSTMSKNSRRGQKRRKTSSDSGGWAYTGSEYGTKKASGDVKRKGKLEPYAYWPLDRKMMSRRPEQRTAARKGMASVVKMTKKLEGKSVSSALSLKGFNNSNKEGKRKVIKKKKNKH